MITYKFKAYDKFIVLNEDDLPSAFDPIMNLGDAMCIANEELLWTTPDACEGSWELNETEKLDNSITYTYYWNEISKMPLNGGIIAD